MPKNPEVQKLESAPEQTTAVAETATPSAPPVMKMEDLLALMANMQQQMLIAQQQNAEAQAALANAILDSKKPYEDPKRAENEELFKKQAQEIEERRKRTDKAVQDSCEHIAGSSSLSDSADLHRRTSIVWHRGDVGQIFGVCTTCLRQFHQDDPDFGVWRSKKSFNKMSASGDRYVPNPVQAQKESRL